LTLEFRFNPPQHPQHFVDLLTQVFVLEARHIY
jgi:hypothetical protein